MTPTKGNSDEGADNASAGRAAVGNGFTVVESPGWLPKGWITWTKTRKSGYTAGVIDKYFIDPVSHRKFRSKKAVFTFLELCKLTEGWPKCKKDDTESKTSAGGGNNPRALAAGDKRSSQSTSGVEVNNRPTKVRWVYNGSEGSWVPEEINESNRDGEVNFDINDKSDHEQFKSAVSEDLNHSTRLTFETEINLNKPANEGSPLVSPFGDSWPDPCLEFAFKTLTGAIPVLDDNLNLQDAFQEYILPQTNENTDHPFSTEQRASSSWKDLDGSKNSQNFFFASDGFPKSVTKVMTHQAKNLLEPLGRELCKKAIALLMESGHSSLLLKRKAKTKRTSFRSSQRVKIDSVDPEQNTVIIID